MNMYSTIVPVLTKHGKTSEVDPLKSHITFSQEVTVYETIGYEEFMDKFNMKGEKAVNVWKMMLACASLENEIVGSDYTHGSYRVKAERFMDKPSMDYVYIECLPTIRDDLEVLMRMYKDNAEREVEEDRKKQIESFSSWLDINDPTHNKEKMEKFIELMKS